jgi:Mrp family chromosome partitioning ATPase
MRLSIPGGEPTGVMAERFGDIGGGSTVAWTPARASRLARRAAPLVILPAVVFAIVVAIVDTARKETTYRSQAQVAVAQTPPRAPTPSLVTQAMTSDAVLRETVRRAGVALDLSEARSALTASSDTGTGIVTLVAQRPDSTSAASLADAYATVFRSTLDGAVRAQIQKRRALLRTTISKLQPKSGDVYNSLLTQSLSLDSAIATPVTTLVSPASTPVGATTGMKRDVAAALVLGALLGIGAAGLREVTSRRIDDADEIGARLGLPVVWSPGEGEAALAATLLDQRLGGAGLVAVVGAAPDAGGAEFAAGLACAFADGGRETILVDASFDAPGLDGIAARRVPGLSDVAAGSATIEDAIGPSADGRPCLRVVPAGEGNGRAVDLLRKPSLQSALDELRTRAELVVVHAPEAPEVAEAAAVAVRANGLVVVVRSESVTAPEVDQLRGFLSLLPVPKLGVAVTPAARGRRNGPASAQKPPVSERARPVETVGGGGDS